MSVRVTPKTLPPLGESGASRGARVAEGGLRGAGRSPIVTRLRRRDVSPAAREKGFDEAVRS
jgi:hypothetical protein